MATICHYLCHTGHVQGPSVVLRGSVRSHHGPASPGLVGSLVLWQQLDHLAGVCRLADHRSGTGRLAAARLRTSHGLQQHQTQSFLPRHNHWLDEGWLARRPFSVAQH